jgi:hypothetical protein
MRRSLSLLILLIIPLCVVGVIAVLRNDHRSTQPALTQFYWQAAGIHLAYPENWYVASISTAPSSSLPLDSGFSVLSREPGDYPTGYFCILFRLEFPFDQYTLENGHVISTLDDGLALYQSVQMYGGHGGVRVWLTDPNNDSQIQLADGRYVSAQVIYDCGGGDLAYSDQSVTDQEESLDFQMALNILKSVAFDGPPQIKSRVRNLAIASVSAYEPKVVRGGQRPPSFAGAH